MSVVREQRNFELIELPCFVNRYSVLYIVMFWLDSLYDRAHLINLSDCEVDNFLSFIIHEGVCAIFCAMARTITLSIPT